MCRCVCVCVRGLHIHTIRVLCWLICVYKAISCKELPYICCSLLGLFINLSTVIPIIILSATKNFKQFRKAYKGKTLLRNVKQISLHWWTYLPRLRRKVKYISESVSLCLRIHMASKCMYISCFSSHYYRCLTAHLNKLICITSYDAVWLYTVKSLHRISKIF